MNIFTRFTRSKNKFKRQFYRLILVVKSELGLDCIHCTGHEDRVTALDCQDGLLFSSSDDHSVRIWNTETGTQACVENDYRRTEKKHLIKELRYRLVLKVHLAITIASKIK